MPFSDRLLWLVRLVPPYLFGLLAIGIGTVGVFVLGPQQLTTDAYA